MSLVIVRKKIHGHSDVVRSHGLVGVNVVQFFLVEAIDVLLFATLVLVNHVQGKVNKCVHVDPNDKTDHVPPHSGSVRRFVLPFHIATI